MTVRSGCTGHIKIFSFINIYEIIGTTKRSTDNYVTKNAES